MKNFKLLLFISFLFFCLSQTKAQNKDLPKYMTDYERTIMDSYLSSFDNKGITTPPPYANIRTAAEWEEVQALVITWTGQYNTIHKQIIDAAQEECTVIIHCSDSNSVKSFLNGQGVPDVNIDYLEVPFNSVWIRDYGANTCYANMVEDVFLTDWIYNRPRPSDDAMPDAYGEHLGIDVYSTSANPTKVMSTGGNWMSDGDGIAFSSNLILDENDGNGDFGSLNYPDHTEQELDQIFQDWMGIDEYIKMTVLPYDEIHHIDMHMKLLDEETLLIGEYPIGTSDGPQIEANIQYVIDNFTTKFGTPLKVVRIPQPSATSGNFPPNAYYRTYTNLTFVNNTILLPTYRTEYDTIAFRILEENLPGYTIAPIDIDNSGQNLISSGGGIHCITHTVGVSEPIYISHKKLENTSDTQNDYMASATILHRNGIASASLWYKTNLTDSYVELPMTNNNGDQWNADIPAQPLGTTIYYYIEGIAANGKQGVHPFPAPEGYHKFDVMDAGTANLAEGKSLELEKIYPNPAKAITVIPVVCNKAQNIKITMIDLKGSVVKEIFSGEVSAGEKNFFIDASQYPSGIYQVSIRTDVFEQKQKLVIQ
ncbi:agmatine deiminase family protein [Crocinitomicaceae bacterium]|nr:agmatine deiminase family protein [Crocinitomicaceae bacterium]